MALASMAQRVACDNVLDELTDETFSALQRLLGDR